MKELESIKYLFAQIEAENENKLHGTYKKFGLIVGILFLHYIIKKKLKILMDSKTEKAKR